jgi:choline dehydrogenase-like flavoprotein
VTASGVSFVVDGTTYTVNASREVILAASSVGSPQLLELSGVGSAQALGKLGIKSVVDLPTVGENMQEHVYVILVRCCCLLRGEAIRD